MSNLDQLTSEQKKKYAHTLKEFHKIFSEKRCMSRDNTCSGKVVRSHTVSKSQYLINIAESDHVLQWQLFPWAKTKTESLQLKLTGINDASTFNGFCKHHDTSLFLDIDTKPFGATPKQLFFQAYRAHARELYNKRAQILAFPGLEKLAEFHELEGPQSYVPSVEDVMYVSGAMAGLKDTLLHNNHLRSLIKSGEFNRMRTCVIPLMGTPVIAAAGSFFPTISFEGEPLQDLADFDSVLESLHFSILPEQDVSYACLSFIDNGSNACEKFIQSVLSCENLASILIWITFIHIENMQLKPSWWETLNKEHKDMLLKASEKNRNVNDVASFEVADFPNIQLTELVAQNSFWI